MLDIQELKAWHKQYLDNIGTPFSFDWDAWNKRCRKIAEIVAEAVLDNMALFYPFEDEVKIEEKWNKDGYYLNGPYKKVRNK